MERPLYGAALLLNPGKYFDYCEKEPDVVWKLEDAFANVLERMVPDQAMQDKINDQLNNYKAARVNFSRAMAIRQRKTLNPIDWWSTYGGLAFELKNLAMRILSLYCSSSSCERNWSTFEFIHSKKRNRLEHQRLNDLVYVQYNRRLHSRFKERCEQGRNYDPLQLDELDWSREWMVSHPHEDLAYLDNDLTWQDVDRAIGAYTELVGRILPRRAQALVRSVIASSSRFVRKAPVEESSDSGESEEGRVVEDDGDINDNFSQGQIDSTSHQALDVDLADDCV